MATKPLQQSAESDRLRQALQQLRMEAAVLERVAYKNKNQHRRAPYYQCLLKVRRDLRLLIAAEPSWILDAAFAAIEGRRGAPKHFVSVRQSKNTTDGKYNYMERLLGVARLLSEMIEPLMQATIQISLLLSKSFFVGFSIVVLSLLARIRALSQQILLGVVSVFNKVSDLAQKKPTMKLTSSGIEAFPDRHLPGQEAIVLECGWEQDKYVLHERSRSSETTRYETLEILLGEQSMEAQEEPSRVEPSAAGNPKSVCFSADQPWTSKSSCFAGSTECDDKIDLDLEDQSLHPCTSETNHGNEAASVPSSIVAECRPKNAKRVAFVTVGNPTKAPCTPTSEVRSKRQKLDATSAVRDSTDELDDIFASVVDCRTTERSIF